MESLPEENREPYLLLGVFPEDVPFPINAAAALWQFDPYDTEDLLHDLVGQALLTPRHFGNDTRYVLHDLLHKFVRGQLDPTGGGDGIKKAHVALVDGYRTSCEGKWTKLKPDGYVFEHIAHLMNLGGLVGDLYASVLDSGFRLAQQRALGDSNATLDALRLALDIALKEDDITRMVCCAGAFRSTFRSINTAGTIFKSVEQGDIERALSLASLYGRVPDWPRALYL